jgi:hypothetical protein
MLTVILRWIAAFIVGIAALTVVTLSGLLFSAIGAIAGFISMGTMLIVGVTVIINEWWQSRK